jgi:arylformamidase
MTIDLEAEYNNRARVPEHPALIAGWAQDAAAYRAQAGERMSRIAYGPGERQHIDVFAPERADPEALPVLFIHGGYWQALDPSFFSHMARGLNAHGVTVGIAGYDLCPDTTVGLIIEQMREAARALSRLAGRKVVAAGHSAGGHLAACLAATDWAGAAPGGGPLVPAALAISGLFELEPLIATTVNAKLGMTLATAREWSPRLWPPPAGIAFDAWVGGKESAEYLRQSAGIAAVWSAAGNDTRMSVIEGADHFTAIAGLADRDSAMTLRLAEMASVAGLPGFGRGGH